MISKYGDGADILFRIGLDGNDVKLWIEEPAYRENFDGIVPKAQDWRVAARWCDIAVFDNNKQPQIWKQLQQMGVPCFGGSEFGFKLEQDREYAHSLMNRLGMSRVESMSFKSLKEVIPHLKEHKVPHVVKPCGNKCESFHLIVGENSDNSDVIAQVERLIEQGLPVESVEVEEKKKGVEVGVAGYFNGNDWVGPVEINFEHKRLHNGEIGHLTGEMGTLMRFVQDPELPLWTQTLGRMAPVLRAANYRGQLDLNMIVDEMSTPDKLIAWPLEFTPRLGYPAVFLSSELQVTPWGKVFDGVAKGKDVAIQVHYDWCVGVVAVSAGFPFEKEAIRISKGLPVFGVDEQTLLHFHPQQMSMRKGKFNIANGEGYVGVATGKGPTIGEAKDAAYETMRRIKFPNMSYRTDISDKIEAWRLESRGILPIEESVP
jgi:phosphoribosylamine--glycine ligase